MTIAMVFVDENHLQATSAAGIILCSRNYKRKCNSHRWFGHLHRHWFVQRVCRLFYQFAVTSSQLRSRKGIYNRWRVNDGAGFNTEPALFTGAIIISGGGGGNFTHTTATISGAILIPDCVTVFQSLAEQWQIGVNTDTGQSFTSGNISVNVTRCGSSPAKQSVYSIVPNLVLSSADRLLLRAVKQMLRTSYRQLQEFTLYMGRTIDRSHKKQGKVQVK